MSKLQQQMHPTADDVLRYARQIWNRDPDKERSLQTEDIEFRELFGCGVLVFLSLWELLVTNDAVPDGGTIKHLLWTLMFLKVYAKQATLCSLAGGVDKETYRKWCWLFIEAIAGLESHVVSKHHSSISCFRSINSAVCLLLSFQIIFEDRFKGDKGNDCLMTVDCTDFRVAEQGKKFYSFKYKKSGVRYEICLCILTGDIVWINGPFECGMWNDIMIFRSALMTELSANERVEADDGYIGEHPRHIKCPRGIANLEETEFMQQRVRNRQESINKRFKDWGALRQIWRHAIPRHGETFRVICMVSQLAINDGEKLFKCGYRDPPY
jgi:hypothetical protein